jgi:peptidoglycan/xylan/chitin deacetylase (PgdA/CDA1 family)
MKKRLTSYLEAISRSIPINWYSRIMHRDVIDFFWHAVSDEPMPHVCHLYPVVPTLEFEAALLYLKENFTFVSYPELHAYVFEGADLPNNAVHISFDDGYVECFKCARPLLLKHDIPCTFFLTTNLIDNTILFYRNKQSLCVERLNNSSFNFHASRIYDLDSTLHSLPEFISRFKDLRLPDEPLIDEICSILEVDWHYFLVDKQPYLTTAQIQQMHAEGFTIGAHTQSHRKLADLSEDEIKIEIIESCQIVGEITGQEIVPFSFPHSAWGLDRDHLAAIRANQSKIGLLFDTKGLRQDVDFIHNRIWAERPLPSLTSKGDGIEEIKDHLLLAYQEAWIDEMMAKGRLLWR